MQLPKLGSATFGVRAALLCAGVCSTPPALAQDDCFVRLDNGTDLTGWSPSATNHHGPGEGWVVEDGALTGRQTAGQKGGILMTDQSYSDVEVVFEVKIDWGCDSGFFLRTTAGNRAYQACLDHLEPDSSVGSIYGEGFSESLLIMPYTLTSDGNAAVAAAGQTPLFDVAEWSTLWKPTEFNEMRARIEGNPPRLQIWISDVKVADYTDTVPRGEIDASGPLAIQVHGGERWTEGGKVQFRNIRVRDLTQDCAPSEPGTAGSAGASGNGGASGSGDPDAGGAAGKTTGGGSGAGGAPTTPSAGSNATSGGPSSAGGSSSAGAAAPSSREDSSCNAGRRPASAFAAVAASLLMLAYALRRRR